MNYTILAVILVLIGIFIVIGILKKIWKLFTCALVIAILGGVALLLL